MGLRSYVIEISQQEMMTYRLLYKIPHPQNSCNLFWNVRLTSQLR